MPRDRGVRSLEVRSDSARLGGAWRARHRLDSTGETMIENNYDLIANDALLPSQLTRHAPVEPENLLWFEVLDQAVRDYQLTVGEQGYKAVRLFREVAAWFADTAVELGSFEWVCEIFDVDPHALRKALGGIKVGPRRSPVLGRPRYMQAVREGRATT